jgi:hypothetical protein
MLFVLMVGISCNTPCLACGRALPGKSRKWKFSGIFSLKHQTPPAPIWMNVMKGFALRSFSWIMYQVFQELVGFWSVSFTDPSNSHTRWLHARRLHARRRFWGLRGENIICNIRGSMSGKRFFVRLIKDIVSFDNEPNALLVKLSSGKSSL